MVSVSVGTEFPPETSALGCSYGETVPAGLKPSAGVIAFMKAGLPHFLRPQKHPLKAMAIGDNDSACLAACDSMPICKFASRHQTTGDCHVADSNYQFTPDSAYRGFVRDTGSCGNTNGFLLLLD